MTLYDELKTEIDALLAAFQTATSDKHISVAEAITLILKVLELVAHLAQRIPSTDEQKKELLLQLADAFYDQVLGPMDIPGVPDWLENRFVDPKVGEVWHQVASGMIDYVLTKVKN